MRFCSVGVVPYARRVGIGLAVSHRTTASSGEVNARYGPALNSRLVRATGGLGRTVWLPLVRL